MFVETRSQGQRSLKAFHKFELSSLHRLGRPVAILLYNLIRLKKRRNENPNGKHINQFMNRLRQFKWFVKIHRQITK